METAARPPDATPSVDKRSWAMPLVSGLVVLAVALAALWWFGIRDSDGDLSTTEQLYGTWQDVTPSLFGYYLVFDEEGVVDTYFSSNIDGSPNQWGTYSLNGDILTMTDSEDAPYCRGAVSVWTVSFSSNGDEAYFTFASDECRETLRGRDWTLVRQSS